MDFFSLQNDLHLFHTFYLTGAVTEEPSEHTGEVICTDHSQSLTQLERLKEKQMLRSVSVSCDKVFTSAQLLSWWGGKGKGEKT